MKWKKRFAKPNIRTSQVNQFLNVSIEKRDSRLHCFVFIYVKGKIEELHGMKA